MSDKYIENFTNYQQPLQCSKQVHTNDALSQFSYNNNASNTFTPSTNFMDIYGNISYQNINRCQQGAVTGAGFLSEQNDIANWENRLIPDVEKLLKIPDKIEMIEITSKDLSPASFGSNELLSDIYKTPNKDLAFYNKYESQWSYNQTGYGQKIYEFPSCAQVSSNHLDKSKYCNVQRNQDFDYSVKSCNFSDSIYSGNNVNSTYFKTSATKTCNSIASECNNYNYYEKYTENPPNTNFYNSPQIQFQPVNTIDQHTECSNEDSDIIVEESDEEVTDYSEDQDKNSYYQMNKCLICNMMYAPLGTQFYILTNVTPLTMSSQKPVISKIVDILGKIATTQNYICSECLGLVNTIDHLQFKLIGFMDELNNKFQKSCKENSIPLTSTIKHNKSKVRNLKKSFVNKFPAYKCKLCKKVLCLKKYCYYHFRKHKNRGFLCELCGKISSTKNKFSLHLKQHKAKVYRIEAFKCCNCNKTFRTKHNMKEHENYCIGTLPYKCKHQHCDKKFASTTKLKNHIKLKHDKKFIAICSICNIGFIKVSDYKTHKTTHSTVKKFICKICEKSYKTISNLNFHMKVHSEKLPFICRICDKGFMRKEYLDAHVNNHNGIKNYICTFCNKKFVSQKNLDSHLKYHEGTINKKTCNICGKTMTTGYEEHLRIHNNLREFECTQCDMKFNTKGTLRKHVINKHRPVQ